MLVEINISDIRENPESFSFRVWFNGEHVSEKTYRENMSNAERLGLQVAQFLQRKKAAIDELQQEKKASRKLAGPKKRKQWK